MKKILSTLFLLSLSIILLTSVVLAQEQLPTACTIRRNTGIAGCPGVGAISTYDTDYAGVRGAMCCAVSAIYYTTDWIFLILLLVAVIVGVLGGLTIVTAAGDAAKVTTGRNYIMYAIVGVAVALLARAIPGIAKAVMGV